ncbi:MAG TPA: hypothetical protein DDX54_00410 [Rhodospirillaceae bacterium]|jgi:hypothetical protein|nr:hypothetical protein [Alphaproteobacteria bacterium]HBH25855.1 hypothetical protein [Rhodospirillaceae bacterium]
MGAQHAKSVKAETLVPLGEHVQIVPAERLPAYDAGPAQAYGTRTVGLEESVPLLTLVGERSLFPREDAISTYGLVVNSSLLPLVAKGVVDWPEESGGTTRRYAFVYKNIIAAPLAALAQEKQQIGLVAEMGPSVALGLKPEWVCWSVLLPLARVLQDFYDKDFVHGRINPHNIFHHVDKSVTKAVLGECLVTPPSFAQFALYETAERAMADPIGRGLGTLGDDMYALGVTLAVLLRHADPMAKMDLDAAIRHKMDVGSYHALMGEELLSGPILEMLRGLLMDDPSERWGVGALLSWIDGRRLSQKQSRRRKAAQRPLNFAGGRYLRPDFLAMDLRRAPEQIDALLESGEMETWVTRSLEDEALSLRLDRNVRAARETGRSGAAYLERLACYVAIALDPDAPIRYGSVAVHPEGIGIALAHAMARSQGVDAFGQILSQGIVLNWVASQEGLLTSLAGLTSRFDECRLHMRQSKTGYGVERCVYTLNTGCPCLSPNFSGHFVHTAEDMLRALEAICAQGKPPASFLDRHAVAFLVVRDKKAVEAHLFDLGAAEPNRVLVGTLACLAALQKRTGVGPLPALATALAERLSGLYERFYDRSLRESLQKSVRDFAQGGHLSKIAAILENEALARQDRVGFRQAQLEYLRVTHEFRGIADQMDGQEIFGKKVGQQVGATVSAGIAGIILLVVVFVYMTGKSLFPPGSF